MPEFKNRSAEASLLSQLLAKAKKGDVITYTQMSDCISMPVHGATPSLQSAIRIVRNDHDMVFACIRGTGYQRLDDSQIVADGTRDLEKIQRTARRASVKQSKVEFDALDNKAKLKFTSQCGILGAVATMAKPKSVERLEGQITATEKTIPFNQTLSLFLKKADNQQAAE